MKKLIVLLSIFALFTTGCSISKVNSNDINHIVDTVLKKKSSLKNVHFEGYSYYIPKGLTFLDKNDYNAKLKDQYGNYYYLYVDVVSRYHKTKKKYQVNSKAYYSKKITNGKKFGYLEINKIEDKYFVEAMYNYMKVEAYIDRNNLQDALVDISTILSSCKYNDKVLDTIIGENILNYKEESYNIFETKKNNTDFLDYIKEYDSYDEEVKDEDNLQIEEGE